VPVILAREAEIRRFKVQGQFRQNICETSYQPLARCSGIRLSSQLQKRLRLGGWQFQANLGKK
jgi:hypothetical protein